MTLPSPSSGSRPLLNSLVQRLQTNPAYMASALAGYQKQESISNTVLAQQLGIDENQLPRLALCKRPRQKEGVFQKDVCQIAAYVGANEIMLGQILRQIEVIEAFKESTQTPSRGGVQKSSTLVILAAARDQEAVEPPHEPDQKEPDKDD
jgi:hypothetical protein